MLWLAPASLAATHQPPVHVCAGTQKHPGSLHGTFLNVVVHGVCAVNHGPAIVLDDLVIDDNSGLIAAFGQHHSRLFVGRDVIALPGAVAVIGCLAKLNMGRTIFPCLDDPNQKHPTLNSHVTIVGTLVGLAPLGVVVHNTWIGGDVRLRGGGGGLTCAPIGLFKAFGLPAYTDFENNMIVGNVFIRHMHSCYMGFIRNWIGSSVTISSNVMADPDAMEITTNVVLRDLTCWRDHPAAQFGDGHGQPNRVGANAMFQCGFDKLLPWPAGQHKVFKHISVHLHESSLQGRKR